MNSKNTPPTTLFYIFLIALLLFVPACIPPEADSEVMDDITEIESPLIEQ